LSGSSKKTREYAPVSGDDPLEDAVFEPVLRRARLLALSGTDELVATRAAPESTADRFAWASRGSTKIRGFREPGEVYRLVEPR
jgi:class 3 adenylate cyclase